MRIRVLIENGPSEYYKTEHGLSLQIIHNGKQYLLDAGSSKEFLWNLDQMNVWLEDIDAAFLSHGHYDHSGGFGAFIRSNNEAPIYAMEGALGRFASDSGGVFHEIGVPQTVKEALADRVTFIKNVTQVADGVTLIPHSTPGLETIGKRAGLYVHREGEWMPDDFAHEMSVVFESEGELVVMNSCSHAGLKNIVEEVKAALPGKKVAAYIGGLHMKGKRDGKEICTYTPEEVKALADYIKAEGLQVLYTGHCTGAPAYEMLRQELGGAILKRLQSDREIIINERESE